MFSSESLTKINGIYTAYDDNVIVLSTSSGVFEVSFEQLATALRFKEEIVGDLQLLLRQNIAATKDGHIVVATSQFNRLGYSSKIYGRSQRELLNGVKNISFNLEEHRFLAVKEDKTLATFIMVDDQVAGFSKVSLKGSMDKGKFLVENIGLKAGKFFCVGYFSADGPMQKKVIELDNTFSTSLAVQENAFYDFRNKDYREKVEAEVVFNPLLISSIPQTASLYRGSISKIRLFGENFNCFTVGIIGRIYKNL